MKVNTFWHRCGRHRKHLSLLVSGILPEQQRPTLERHLTSCPDCARYHTELARVAVRFQSARTAAEGVLPSPACRERWRASLRHNPTRSSALRAESGSRQNRLSKSSCAWPNTSLLATPHVAWAGLACIWLLAAFFRFSGPSQSAHVARPALAPPQVALRVLRLDTSQWPNHRDELRQTPFRGTRSPEVGPRSQQAETKSRV